MAAAGPRLLALALTAALALAALGLPVPLALREAVTRHGPVGDWDAAATAGLVASVGFADDVVGAVSALDVTGSVLLHFAEDDAAELHITSGVDLARWRALCAALRLHAAAAAPRGAPAPHHVGNSGSDVSLWELLVANPASFHLNWAETIFAPAAWVLRARWWGPVGAAHTMLLLAPGRPTLSALAWAAAPFALPVAHYASFLRASPLLALLGMALTLWYAAVGLACEAAAAAAAWRRAHAAAPGPTPHPLYVWAGQRLRELASRGAWRYATTLFSWSVLAALQAVLPWWGLGRRLASALCVLGIALITFNVGFSIWPVVRGRKSLWSALLEARLTAWPLRLTRTAPRGVELVGCSGGGGDGGGGGGGGEPTAADEPAEEPR
jgi:hypothetical protein